MSLNKLFILIFEFVFVFYFLQAMGPLLDEGFSMWTGSLAPFGEIMRFLVPGPDKYLLTIIESFLITVGSATKI